MAALLSHASDNNSNCSCVLCGAEYIPSLQLLFSRCAGESVGVHSVRGVHCPAAGLAVPVHQGREREPVLLGNPRGNRDWPGGHRGPTPYSGSGLLIRVRSIAWAVTFQSPYLCLGLCNWTPTQLACVTASSASLIILSTPRVTPQECQYAGNSEAMPLHPRRRILDYRQRK